MPNGSQTATAKSSSDPRLELAYKEASRAITQQQASLSGLRTRAGALFGAANIATAFLAGVALENQDLVPVSWIATLCFVGVCGLTVSILLPRRGWVFEQNSRVLVEEWIDEKDLGIDAIHKHLALFMRTHYERNQTSIDKLFRQYVWASLLLGVEIVAWLFDLGQGVQ
ncbi:MAG TPA: hypothetical protein VEV43_09205 [Actinomycetota bacterium]|nr:hypothetical protein [Actinomycetota bacterium]